MYDALVASIMMNSQARMVVVNTNEDEHSLDAMMTC